MVYQLPTRARYSLPQLCMVLLTAACLFCISVGIAQSTEPLSADNTIRLQLRWNHQFQFAGYYAAIEKGYYKEAGLEVILVEDVKGKSTIDEVINGNAQYGVTNSELLLHRLNGKPLVALAAIFQHSPLVFIARSETGITVPQDLSGKIVKLSRASRDIELQATLHDEGIAFDKLILLEDVATYEDYFDKNIDALAAYSTNQPYYLREKDVPFNIIRPSTYGIDFYGDCLFTSEQEIIKHPQRARAFREASLRGWEYALNNQEEIINLIKGKYRSEKSLDHLRYEAEEIRKLILPDLVEIGHMNPGRWDHIAKTFLRFQLIPAHYSLEGFIYQPESEKMQKRFYRTLLLLAVIITLISIVSAALFLFNRRLKREIEVRRATEEALQLSERKLLHYARQTEQFSLSAASILSIRDEKELFAEMSKAIVELSDFERVLIILFREEPPFRELIGYAGISEDTVAKVRSADISRSWYDDIFSLGIRLGNLSYYIPHTMKHILNQDAVIYGEGRIPDSESLWHPQDNLFVRMNDERGELIGVISVDTSKSGAKPTDEVVRPLEIYASLIAQIIILKREHSRRHQLEQKLRLAQKMEALGNLTGGIAHDFNNILGIIVGNTELAMLDTPKWMPTHHNLREIKTVCFRARDIVQHLLTFSRKSDKELRPVVAADMLRDSLRFLSASFPATIQMTSRMEISNEEILADPPQIYQALLNLCTNAVQAMESKGGCLTFAAGIETLHQPMKSLTHEVPAGRYLRVDITDTGHGIAQNLLEKIFDPYYTTRDFGKGTGMGLAIVHGIIQSHNGAIQVRSSVDTGTTFSLYLPVIENSPPATPANPQKLPQGNETILLVDDDQALLDVGRQMLEKQGYTVVAHNNPDTALTVFRQNPKQFHLLITDMSMPELSGSMLATKVLEIDPGIPIFLCTGYSDQINEQHAVRIGITRYFEKPLDIEQFSAAIRQVLDDRSRGLPI